VVSGYNGTKTVIEGLHATMPMVQLHEILPQQLPVDYYDDPQRKTYQETF